MSNERREAHGNRRLFNDLGLAEIYKDVYRQTCAALFCRGAHALSFAHPSALKVLSLQEMRPNPNLMNRFLLMGNWSPLCTPYFGQRDHLSLLDGDRQ